MPFRNQTLNLISYALMKVYEKAIIYYIGKILNKV